MDYMIGNHKQPSIKKGGYHCHTHDYCEIVCFVNGQCDMRVGDKTFNLGGGDILVVPPNVLHGASSQSQFETIFMGGGADLFNLEQPLVIKDNHQGEGLFLARAICDNRLSNNEYLNALHRALCEFIMQNAELQDRLSVAINKIVSQVATNFADINFNLNELLNDSGYAEDYVRAKFKKLTGKTPVEFLTQARIDHAKRLIEIYKDALPLYEICMQSGFSDYVYFSRRFKQLTGKSPQGYKAMFDK